MAFGLLNIPDTESGYYNMSIPSQSGTLTYNGKDQTPAWNYYDKDKMTIEVTAQKNVGTYTATFTPIDPYIWSDGTLTAKSVSWTIAKANSSFTLSATSVSLTSSELSKEVTVTKTGTTGAVTATSSNTSVATVSVSGNKITITAVKTGSATITVKVAGDSNYNAPANKTIAVTCKLVSTTLSENTPAQIKEIAQAGQAGNYWKVGDTIDIPISGTVGTLAINGTYKAVILGINHNKAVEGNSVHFIIGKDSGGKDIAFCDSKYGKTSTEGFVINTSNTIAGGWEGSYMRKTICPAFLSALPTEWQNAISACVKWSDNGGNTSDKASDVTSTSDKIFILSEFEVQGTRAYANSAEQTHQSQYDYYKNGNSKIRYRHDANTTAVAWWLRSMRNNSASGYCLINNGSIGGNAAYYCFGFAPAFKL